MRAAYLVAPRHVELRDVSEPVVGPTDALVRIHAGGICGSDISTYLGTHFLRKPPVVLGHEVAGEVMHVGAEVKVWRSGDRVAIEPQIPCGTCRFCAEGETSICSTKKMPGIGFPGLFSDLVSMPASTLHRLPEGLTWEEGAMVEPAAVAYRALLRAGLRPGARVAILGAGSIGALIAAISASTTDAAALVVDTQQDNLDRIAHLTGYDVARACDGWLDQIEVGEGFDTVFLATSALSALAEAVQLCRPHGEIIVVATYGTPPPTDLSALVVRELSIKGTHAYTGDDFAAVAALMSSGRLAVAPLITHRYALSDAKRAFDDVGSGISHLKVMLEFAP